MLLVLICTQDWRELDATFMSRKREIIKRSTLRLFCLSQNERECDDGLPPIIFKGVEPV